MRIGRALLRVIVGVLFVGHGTQKLFGWFGGDGPDGTAGMFEKLGLRPPKAHAVAAGTAEALGGAMLAAGLLTPVASTMLSSVMITAIRKVHAQNGVWNTERGYEYNAVLLATLFALTEHGPGPYSVDAAAFPRLRGTGFAIAQLALGFAGSELATSELVNAPKEEIETAPPDITGDGRPARDRAPVAA